MTKVGIPTLILILLCGLATDFPCPSKASESKHQDGPQTDLAKTAEPKLAKYLLYRNKKYRFRFSLPRDWKGYSIVVGEWGGSAYEDQQPSPTKSIDGPLITIRHPLWTKENPYQDIPVMVFTHAQWKYAAENRLVVRAAPVGPSEIGRNSKYVFALPPRFDYGDAPGNDEVRELIGHHPLHAY